MIKLSEPGQRPVGLAQVAAQVGVPTREAPRLLLHLTWRERVDLRDGLVHLDAIPDGPRRYQVEADGRPVGSGKGCGVDTYPARPRPRHGIADPAHRRRGHQPAHRPARPADHRAVPARGLAHRHPLPAARAGLGDVHPPPTTLPRLRREHRGVRRLGRRHLGPIHIRAYALCLPFGILGALVEGPERAKLSSESVLPRLMAKLEGLGIRREIVGLTGTPGPTPPADTEPKPALANT